MTKKLALGLLATAFVAASAVGQTVYPGNGSSDFGGEIGNGSLSLSSDGTTLTGTITRGNTAGPDSGFADALVFYFDTQAGGRTTLPTSGEIGSPDYGRRSVVNEFGSGITSFPSAFAADFALTLSPDPSHFTSNLFSFPLTGSVDANNLNFLQTVTFTPSGTTNATYTFSLSLSSIGVAAGDTFAFVTTYGNPLGGSNDATFRSAEAFNTAPTGTGFSNSTFSQANSFTVVPEPSTLSLLAGPAILGAWFYVRRRRA